MPTLNLGAIRLAWRQDWTSSATYAPNDGVQYAGDSFVALTANTNQPPTTAGTLNSTHWSYLARGATALTAKGDLLFHNGTQAARLPIGATGQMLTTNTAGEPAWAAANGRPAQTVQASGLPSFRAGYGNPDGQHSVLFISSDRKRLKTIGRSLYGSGLYGRTDDVTLYYPQDAVLVTPLGTDEYFVGVRSGAFAHFAWTNLGNVYAGGYNHYGQLGFGDTTNRAYLDRIPYFVTNGISIAKVGVASNAYGQYSTTFFLDTNGKMYACGYNNTGQLGDGTTTNRSTPVQCGTITGITDFDIGTGSTTSVYAWKADGTLYTWGYNGYGQLGLGDTTSRSAPVLSTLTGVKYARAAAGNYHNGSTWADERYRAFVLKTDGLVFACGNNEQGQLGVGDTTQRTAWTQTAGGLVNVLDLYVGNGWASVCFAVTNTTGTNPNQTYCWGHANGNSTLWQSDTSQRTSPVLFGQTAANAQNWEKFWPVTWQRQNCVIGKKTDGKFYFAGNSSHGNGSHLPSGNQSLTLMADLSKYGISDIAVNQYDGVESGLTFYFLTNAGEVLSAGYSSCDLLGGFSYDRSRNAAGAIRF